MSQLLCLILGLRDISAYIYAGTLELQIRLYNCQNIFVLMNFPLQWGNANDIISPDFNMVSVAP